MAVNLASNPLAGGALVRQVSRALADTGLAPERLCLETAESLLLHYSGQVMQTLEKLRSFGVSIAMDDFGTGLSSLTHASHAPADRPSRSRAQAREPLFATLTMNLPGPRSGM